MKNIVGRSKPRNFVLCHFFPSVCYFREKCWKITQTACIRLCVPRQGWFLRAGKFVSDGWPESHRNSLKNERMDREQKISGRKKNEGRDPARKESAGKQAMLLSPITPGEYLPWYVGEWWSHSGSFLYRGRFLKIIHSGFMNSAGNWIRDVRTTRY